VRPRDLAEAGVSRTALGRLVAAGKLERVSRGVYRLADGDVSEHASLVEACKRVPGGVVCLLSALAYHDLTTHGPHQAWPAIERRAWRPRVDYPPLRVVRFSGEALAQGVEVHDIEGVAVKVYGPAKTVADCFKYRRKIGVDVAVAALRDYRARRLGILDTIWRFAEICRVTTVIRPYLEALQ